VAADEARARRPIGRSRTRSRRPMTSRSVGGRGRRRAHPAVGTSTVDRLGSAPARTRAARGRREPRAPHGLARSASARRGAGSMPSCSHRDEPTPWPLGGEERESTSPADEDRVRAPQEGVDDADLVRHLGASSTATSGRCGMLEDPVEGGDLALEQPSGDGLAHVVGDALRRRVRAVRGAERVVDVDRREPGEGPGRARGRSSSPPARSGRSRASGPRRRPALRRGAPPPPPPPRAPGPPPFRAARRAGRPRGAGRAPARAASAGRDGPRGSTARRARAAP
jgi:hypothetical protein